MSIFPKDPVRNNWHKFICRIPYSMTLRWINREAASWKAAAAAAAAVTWLRLMMGYIWSRELVSCVWTVDDAISVSYRNLYSLIKGNLMSFHLIFEYPWGGTETATAKKETKKGVETKRLTIWYVVRIIENAFFVTRIDGAKARRRIIRSEAGPDCCLTPSLITRSFNNALCLDDLTFWTWY